MMTQEAKKKRKKCEKLRKMAKNGPKKEQNQIPDGIRVASSRRGEALPQEACVW